MWAPSIYQTFSRFVADADCGVGSFSDAGFQSGADAGALGSVQVAVSDVKVGVYDVVVPAFEKGGNVFLEHGVGGTHADLRAGEDVYGASSVVGCEGDLVGRG